MNPLFYLAASDAGAAEGGLIGALGIDAKLLLLQAGAFLIFVFILGKFVYPHILKAIDGRRDMMEESAKSAKKAEEELGKVEHKVADIIRKARQEADEIVASANKESAGIVVAAEDKAAKRAEQIVEDARSQMENELNAARVELRQEAAALVIAATEQVIKEKLDATKDAKLISAALKEAS